MKQELKRCPFCGGHAVYKYEDVQDGTNTRKYVYVMCGNCAVATMHHPVKDLHSEFPEKYTTMFPDIYEPYNGEKAVADTWNRRIEHETTEECNEFQPKPSFGGKECLGNGEHEDIEIQCDECEHVLTCFPDATKNL